jgi:hypothetical protein
MSEERGDAEEPKIPYCHTAIRANNDFMDQLALMITEKGWTEEDLKEFLEKKAYRPDTIHRLLRGVQLRLKGTKPPKPKPKRSKDAMTEEEAAKIEDPKARKAVQKYLEETEPAD